MLKATVSDLKAAASEYLTKVIAGEEILVTDGGKPIAKIIPLRRDELPADVRMAQLELAGLARVGKGDLPKEFWNTPRPLDNESAALSALLSERADDRCR